MAGNSRPFYDFLREQRSGVLHDQLSDGLQDLVAACVELGRPGKLILTLTVQPSGDVIMVLDEITAKPPKVINRPSVFFATPDNNLQRTDPRQSALELRALPSIPSGLTKVP